ncbi:hypothetical protein GQ457_01G006380 [Hibiscus cannabinus]
MVVWRGSPTGIFTIAAAYARDLEPLWEAVDSKWSQLWSLPITKRIRLFIWLVLRQRLMTNEEHYRQSFSLDPSCPSCGCVRESILHVLCDSPLRGIYGNPSFLKAAMQSLVFGFLMDSTRNEHGGRLFIEASSSFTVQLKVFVDESDAIHPLIIRDTEGPPYGHPCRDSHSAC